MSVLFKKTDHKTKWSKNFPNNPNNQLYVPDDSDAQRTTPPKVRENQEIEGISEEHFCTNDEITNVSRINSLMNREGKTNGSLQEVTRVNWRLFGGRRNILSYHFW